MFVVLLAALVIVVGALFVWLELLMRAASIYVVVLFLPFAFAALIWPRSAGVLRRVIELLLVLIFSKFVIVAILSLASGALGNADRSAAGVSQAFAGGAVLLLAAFSPFALFKLVPFLEGAAIGGVAGRGAATVGAVVATAGPARVMRSTLATNWDRRGAPPTAGATPSAGTAPPQKPPAASGATPPRAGSAGGGAAAPAPAERRAAPWEPEPPPRAPPRRRVQRRPGAWSAPRPGGKAGREMTRRRIAQRASAASTASRRPRSRPSVRPATGSTKSPRSEPRCRVLGADTSSAR